MDGIIRLALVTGAVLPVWKKLGGLASSGGGKMADVFSKTRIVRAKTDGGRRLVGMAIDGVDEQELLAALGGGLDEHDAELLL